MRMVVHRLVIMVASVGLSLVAAVPGASAQQHNCGEIELIFLNPDLQPQQDNYIHAQGQFFAQFQAIGATADQIAVFGFSFGVYSVEFDPATVCTLPPDAWFTGQQIINYRYDANPDDGFFINLQTALVPDGTYTAAVHGYDDAGNELARYWARAIVDNCDGGDGSRCDGDAAQHLRQDKTMPWPIILPGDGLVLEGVTGFSLEFAEELANLTVQLNGRDITSELEPWEGRLWDDDLIPGYGPRGSVNNVAPECSQQPPQECTTLGEAYKWNGRPLVAADVLRVEATDLAGNKAIKPIHIGSGITGGAITDEFPKLAATFDVTQHEVRPGDPAIFEFTITNSGGAEGHPFASSECDVGENNEPAPKWAGWDCKFDPVHVVVGTGQTAHQTFIAIAPATATTGQYTINTTLEYTAGGDTIQINQPVKVLVNSNLPAPTSSEGTQGEGESTPGVFPVAAILAAAIVAMRRRQA